MAVFNSVVVGGEADCVADTSVRECEDAQDMLRGFASRWGVNQAVVARDGSAPTVKSVYSLLVCLRVMRSTTKFTIVWSALVERGLRVPSDR